MRTRAASLHSSSSSRISASWKRRIFTCRIKVGEGHTQRMIGTCLFFIADNAGLDCGEGSLYNGLAQLGALDGALTEDLDELGEHLSADDETDTVLVYDGVDEGMEVCGNGGLVSAGEDVVYECDEGSASVFLRERTELREFVVHKSAEAVQRLCRQ
jgi:hypothetical protein